MFGHTHHHGKGSGKRHGLHHGRGRHAGLEQGSGCECRQEHHGAGAQDTQTVQDQGRPCGRHHHVGQGRHAERGLRHQGRKHPGAGSEQRLQMQAQEAQPETFAQIGQQAEPQAVSVTGSCPLCRQHCPLSAPQCGQGRAYARSL